jgi:ABC-type polysaccharide/polyol phosphate transport system ATPase subunit
MTSATDALLERDDAVLVVEGLEKRHSVFLEERFIPAQSVFTWFANRRSDVELDLIASGDAGGDADDDEEEGEDEVEDAQDEPLEWRLEDVEFAVQPGEAVGVVGSPRVSIQALTRVLCGMSPPTGGRYAVRGRIAPSVELATTLSRRETHPRRAAKLLARVNGIPRSQRQEYLDALMRLAGIGAAGSDPRASHGIRRVAVAAALDPFADVLVVDSLPELGDPDFLRRCLASIERSLAAGAGAVVACANQDVIAQLCARTIRIEDGRMVGVGPTSEMLAGPRPGGPSVVRGVSARERGFNMDAAILTVEPLDDEGRRVRLFRHGERPTVRVTIETAFPLTTVHCHVHLNEAAGARHTFANDGVLLQEPGRYAFTLELEPTTLPAGTYGIEVAVGVHRGSRRKTLHRLRAGTFAAEGPSGLHGERGSGQWDVAAVVDD